jgi:hypothetical protein
MTGDELTCIAPNALCRATNIRKDLNDSLAGSDRIRLVPPPHFSAHHSAATIGGWSLMVSRNSTKLDQSIDFIKFLLTPESQEVLLTRGGSSPVLKVFFDDSSYIRRYPELADIRRLQEIGVHRPFDERYTRTRDPRFVISQAIRSHERAGGPPAASVQIRLKPRRRNPPRWYPLIRHTGECRHNYRNTGLRSITSWCSLWSSTPPRCF